MLKSSNGQEDLNLFQVENIHIQVKEKLGLVLT